MIKFENVVFGYGEEKNALNYVSFHISEGEQVGLIGANGAGKSTLMKAMLGLIPAKGKITVDEIEVNQENSSRIWQCLRYVFQDSDNQMFMPTVYKMSGGEKRMAAIATILAMNPKVMLMDEPSTALDPKNRRRLIRILQKLPTTKIIATHDLESKMTAADADIYICFVRIKKQVAE